MNTVGNIWFEVRRNQGLVLIIFELFWIAIFLLHRLASSGAPDLPGFVYVNF